MSLFSCCFSTTNTLQEPLVRGERTRYDSINNGDVTDTGVMAGGQQVVVVIEPPGKEKEITRRVDKHFPVQHEDSIATLFANYIADLEDSSDTFQDVEVFPFTMRLEGWKNIQLIIAKGGTTSEIVQKLQQLKSVVIGSLSDSKNDPIETLQKKFIAFHGLVAMTSSIVKIRPVLATSGPHVSFEACVDMIDKEWKDGKIQD